MLERVWGKGNPITLLVGMQTSTATMHWKRLWCWEGLGAGGKGDNRGWDGWMASATQWTWVWVNSGSWWWTGRPGVLRCMGSQRVGHDWATELNWTDSPPNSALIHAATWCWAEFHVVYSKSLLVIHFRDSCVHMTMPDSLTIPFPHSLPLETTSSFSKSLNLFCKFLCIISF